MRKGMDAAVVGGGPAGLAAAMYLARLGFYVCIFEKSRFGGLLLNARRVENYPGAPPMTGPRLAARMKDQAADFGAELVTGRVDGVVQTDEGIELSVDGSRVMSRSLILATGTEPDTGRVSGCEHCHWNWQDIPADRRDVVVLGLGDAAFDQGLSLVEAGKSVTLVGGTVRANRVLASQVSTSAVKVVSGIRLVNVERAGQDMCVRARSRSWKAEAVLVALGRRPAEDLLDSHHPLPDNIRMAGDVQCKNMRQASIAAGDGIRAAMQIADHLGGA